MSRLVIPTNKAGDYNGLIILGKLTEGASITVAGDGVFTFQCENAEQYKNYFKGGVVVENYALKIGSASQVTLANAQDAEVLLFDLPY